MEAGTKINRNSEVSDPKSYHNSEQFERGEYRLQLQTRIFRKLIVCDDVLEVEQTDKHLRSLGAEPETFTGPAVPSSIQRELAGEDDTALCILQPIIVTKQGFRDLKCKLGDSDAASARNWHVAPTQ